VLSGLRTTPTCSTNTSLGIAHAVVTYCDHGVTVRVNDQI
jgi:hypothetical protein